MNIAATTDPLLTPIEPANRLLTAAEFQKLADVPPEVEWFANISNRHTRRAYENAVKDFMRFAGIFRPEEFRTVTRAHLIAWRDELRRRGLGGATIRHRLASLASLFEYLCEKNAVTHNPVKGVEPPAVDPELGLLYFATGNCGPDYDGSIREGDNLFCASIMAVQLKTGKYVWHFQEVHHDIWDYDAASPVVLFDTTIDGKPRKAIAEAGRTGWVYILDRTNGKPLIGINETSEPQEPRQKTAKTQPIPVGDPTVPQCADRRRTLGRSRSRSPRPVRETVGRLRRRLSGVPCFAFFPFTGSANRRPSPLVEPRDRSRRS
jgi:hypothetical protein